MISYHSLARENGENMEQFVADIFSVDINVYSECYDGLYNNCPIEIKSCMNFVGDVYAMSGYRSGRFTLTKKEHEYLIENNGIYIFIVQDTFRKRIKILRAKDIMYKKIVNWKQLFYSEDNNV